MLWLVFVLVAGSGTACVTFLFWLYRESPADTGLRRRWQRWSFTPEDLGGFSLRTLVFASLLGLFLELMLIRWVTSEIRIFAYFKNFVLIACFLGFGLGSHVCRRRIHLMATLLPLVLISVYISFPWRPLSELMTTLPLYLGAFSEVKIWGIPTLDLSAQALSGFLAAMAVVEQQLSLNLGRDGVLVDRSRFDGQQELFRPNRSAGE